MIYESKKTKLLADAISGYGESLYRDDLSYPKYRAQRALTLKDFIRTKYAWPGGYPLFAICSDGGVLCHSCTKENAKQVIRDTRGNDRHSGWNVEAVDVNWEDESLYCDNCGKPIESAYRSDENE